MTSPTEARLPTWYEISQLETGNLTVHDGYVAFWGAFAFVAATVNDARVGRFAAFPVHLLDVVSVNKRVDL